jgi:transcriptional regulator with XRE-family HTH domain
MGESQAVGDRVREVRKRRGLTQVELARASGLSVSLVRKLEQGEYGGIRLETIHKLAVVLRVPTTVLIAGLDTAEASPAEAAPWEAVRRALAGQVSETDQEPTLAGVSAAIDEAVALVIADRHAELRGLLPALIRDADALVASAETAAGGPARRLRSRVRALTAYLMGQTWQFATALDVIEMAQDDASETQEVLAAIDWKCWALIRQGYLAQARDLASQWADDNEPRMSRATREELAAWGRLLVWVSASAARDNRPGEARDALRLARMAASGVGSDFILPSNPWQAFGPMTVAKTQAENAAIQGHPDLTLTLAAQMDARRFPLPRHWHRHRLDVARAHATLRNYPEAADVLREVHQAAPEWTRQQRYARDTLASIIKHRRNLSHGMRDLAGAMRLPLLPASGP